METLIAHSKNETEAKTIKAFFEALEAEYEAEIEMDETERILSNPLHSEQLNKSINDLKNGKGVSVSLDDIWKY